MKRITGFLFLGVIALFASCSTDGVQGQFNANQAPSVWLSAGPPEGSTGKYRVQMFWGGWDPDGEIKGYEYLVSDNQSSTFNPADTAGVPWLPVTGNDSTFTFSADEPGDSVDVQIWTFTRSHTFFIRAVDTEGKKSKDPAYRSFTSRTLSPEVTIDVPKKVALNPADVPPISTFRWTARDFIDDQVIQQEPDSVQWALVNIVTHGNTFPKALEYLRTSAADKEWFPWVWYKAPEDSGKFWTTPPVDLGQYIFAIRAKDEAGAITPVLDENKNVRRVRVKVLTTGPLMFVSNEFIGIIKTTSCASPLTIFDSPAGVSLEFKVKGDASAYGGEMAGYRYGWDISDVNDPEQWEIDLTPFTTDANVATVPARTFFFGTHTITTETVDNSGYCSRIQVKINIIPFTLERNLLVVDDDDGDEIGTAGFENGGSYPNDLEHDAFWLDMASEVAGFDPEQDMINTKPKFIALAKLAQYKSIIWNTNADVGTSLASQIQALLYQYIQYRPKNPDNAATNFSSGKVSPNVLALTMAAGGHVMIAGKHPIQMVVNRNLAKGARYPFIFLYDVEGHQDVTPAIESTLGDASFGYRELCLETLDYAIERSVIRRARVQQKILYCSTEAVRPHGTVDDYINDGMRGAKAADPNFLDVTLRSEVTGPGKFYAVTRGGYDTEVYNPAYFRHDFCSFVPRAPRSCWQPIYNLDCLDQLEPTYGQAVAFWTSAFANRVADVPGAVGARSVVFGFPPVMLDPVQFKPGMEYILFNEWKLPKGSSLAATRTP